MNMFAVWFDNTKKEEKKKRMFSAANILVMNI